MMTPPDSSDPVKRALRVGYSPCPNDTFVFHALVTGRVPTAGVEWEPFLADIETLNEMAFRAELPVTKLSFHAYGRLRERYALLASGAALGRGCGPIVVTRPGFRGPLDRTRIAIPGLWTSAALLLRLHCPALCESQLVPMTFDGIIGSVAAGAVDAGVIIHESRFTFPSLGLVALVDLGEWWERETGLPIPLGAIVADRGLGVALIRAIDSSLRESVLHARARPSESLDYVLEHAQEMAPAVVQAHIALYVNDFTVHLGEEGVRAVEALYRAAEDRGVLPRSRVPLFAEG